MTGSPASRPSREAASPASRLACAAGAGLGDLRRLLRPHEARTVADNLIGLGLAGREPGRTVRRVFRAFGLFVIEFGASLCLAPRGVAARWEWRGLEHLTALNADARGWILAGAHTGNWEALGALAALTGRTLVAPVGVQFHPLLSPAVKRLKRRRAVVSLPAGAGMRPLLRALERGDLVALPLDGGVFRRGREVELLGRHVRLASGAARLSRLSGRPILPVFARRTGFLRQQVHVHPPLCPGNPSIRPGVLPAEPRGTEAVLMQRLADLLGEHLRQAADQWCIFRPLAPEEAVPPCGTAAGPARTTANTL